MKWSLKVLFFLLFVKPLTLIVLGLNIRNRKGLPAHGPAIIAANHNSHLDTLVLMGIYPLSQVHRIRPVAAADYFMKNKVLRWFSLNVMGIVPLERKARKSKEELFSGCKEALEQKQILVLYPEGSRGKAGEMAELKKGIFHISQLVDDTSVTPVLIRGLDKALPKGEALLVPFNCDVIVGESRSVGEDSSLFLENLKNDFVEMEGYCITQ